MARRQPRAGLDESGEAVGDLDGQPGRHDGALAGRELDALAGSEIHAGVALVGARGKRRLGSQPPHPELDHPCTRAEEGASATR